jgi:AGCS family alanine or glycine:cation symporter
MQFRAIWNIWHNLREIGHEGRSSTNSGVHPFKLFFASVGGMIGIGNVVGVGAAIMIGGPGSIFWMWIASFCGMLIKYCEIYLGIKYRVRNNKGGYDGGPMYYLQGAFKSKVFACSAAFLLCLYGVEVYQFAVVVERIEYSFNLDRNLVIFILIAMTLYTSMGGVHRMADVCSILMPIFMITYIGICMYIIIANYNSLPSVLSSILYGAFEGHAPIGGFVGSTFMISASTGVARSVYASDIGIGYDAVVQSETKIEDPCKQARMSIYALFADTFTCMMTTFIFATTGAWHSMSHLTPDKVVAEILSAYIPYTDWFITALLFLAGFTTVVAYLSAGIKSASFLSRKYGKPIYLCYTVISLTYFSRYNADQLMPLMLFVGGLLVLLNISGTVKLVKEIKFY